MIALKILVALILYASIDTFNNSGLEGRGIHLPPRLDR